MSKDNGIVAINISNNDTSYPTSAKLYCNLCSCNLVLLDPQMEEWICSRCNVSYFPNKEKVKKANKFSTPGPETDAHGNITGEKMPLVSMVDDTPRPNDPMPNILEMERNGLRITSWEERV